MKIGFVGGVRNVGSLGMVVESGDQRMLFDYGLTPSKPPSYPRKVPPTENLFLTHSHLDHVGMAPWLCGEYGSSVWGTEVTLEVSVVLLEDSLKVSKFEGYSIPYDVHDVRRFSEESTIMKYGERAHVGDVTIHTHDAGHIPGSTMFSITEGGKEVLFTGDINTVDTRLQTASVPPRCDVCVLESTYSGRPHPPRGVVEREFIAKIEEVLDRGGRVIVPAFAVGRTQELIQVLGQIDEEKWLDGMGRRISKIYLNHQETIRDPRSLKRNLEEFFFVRTPGQRAKAAEAPIILTTSGMLDGGPVLEYVRRMKDQKKNAILLTGYQVEDTNGRMLMDTGTLEIGGEMQKINCEVCSFDFSAHADHEGLVRFAEGTGAKEIILVHGDQRELLAKDLSSFARVHLPDEDATFQF